MGEYGPGISMGRGFMMDKDRIKHAFKHQIMAGETENGFVYAPCTQQEAEEYILSAFDNAVYHCQEATASMRAYDRMLQDLAEQLKMEKEEIFLLYMKYRIEESVEPKDYFFEHEIQMEQEREKARLKSQFTVLRRDDE